MARLKITRLCERCGTPFHPWPRRKTGKARMYCSNDCRRTPIAERLWSQVQKTERCWIWKGDADDDGYGRLWCNERRRSMRAHRVSWELHNDQIPDGFDVLHKCDNPPCVRPDHLFLGTNVENSADRDAKGRTLRGEDHGMAIVTDALVREIRQRYQQGGINETMLGAEYGLSQTAVSQIVLKKCWKHID